MTAPVEPAEPEVIEALRDAISFIQFNARLFRNEGSDAARRTAIVFEAKAAELYPIYERLTGCAVSA